MGSLQFESNASAGSADLDVDGVNIYPEIDGVNIYL
jgi:hypothetical protein